jgi:hypothetical protein
MSATWHCVPGIHRKVHQYLGDLARISANGAQFRIEDGCEFDVFAYYSLQHLFHIDHSLIQVKGPRANDLFPAERKQLSRELYCALTGFANFGEVSLY